jgi:lysophospholipase L1-like esterase
MPLRYIAIGDSYTIGTSVEPHERWPNQLVAALAKDLDRRSEAFIPRLELAANLAVNGFTARDVLLEQVPRLAAFGPGFVSLLVGVNDVIQGVPEDGYRRDVGTILEAVARLVGAGRALFVTTPDYTVTPAGADYGDPTAVTAGIRRFNAIGEEVARAAGVAVVDIHDLSLRAGTDRSLVARDGLHPSGAQYSLWMHRIAPAVAELLARPDN